jgi:membrane protease YdiL (CAAX protease family)
LVASVILAPIAEEFFFRGILFNRIKKKFGITFGVFSSSIIFGFAHYNQWSLGQVVSIIIIGLILALSYIKYNNIIYPIIVHSFWNLLVLVDEKIHLYEFFMRTINGENEVFIGLLSFLGLFLLFIILIIFTIKIIKEKSEVRI